MSFVRFYQPIYVNGTTNRASLSLENFMEEKVWTCQKSTVNDQRLPKFRENLGTKGVGVIQSSLLVKVL